MHCSINNTNNNNTGANVGFIRMHNLPRYTSIAEILHFLWSAIDFEPNEAFICAFSAKNAIVRFKSQFMADEAVRFCSGRSIGGHIVTVHPSDVEELERVKNETNLCPPELKKQIAEKRDGLPTDAAKGNCAANVFPGLLIDSDDDGQDFDMMELKVPDFFMRGRPPDLVDFDAGSAGGSRPGTSLSSSGDNDTVLGGGNSDNNNNNDRTSINTTSSSMSISMTADESETTSEDGVGGSNGRQHRNPLQQQQQPLVLQQQQQMKRKSSTDGEACNGGTLYDHSKGKKLREEMAASGRSGGVVANVVAAQQQPLRPANCFPPHYFPPSHQFVLGGSAVRPAAPPPPPWPQNNGAVRHRPQSPVHTTVFTPVISARHILLQWQLPQHGSSFDVDTQTLSIVCQRTKEKCVLQLGRRTDHLFEVLAGRTYAVTLEGFDVPGTKVTHGTGQYRATFSRAQMQILFARAQKYCGEQMYPFDVLHRSKPKAYWDEIYDSPGGLRIMRPYMKDENGHPGCPINGAIDGLFFSTLLRGKNLPKDSPFGDVQMVVAARRLLNVDTCNMYFADFYCNSARSDEQTQSSVLHYVTVVVCKHDSISDRFCKMKKMIQLDWFNNPFLKVHSMSNSPTAPPQYLAVCRQFNLYRPDTMVEVYYTESFSLFEAEEFNEMITFGKGCSRKAGLPNNKHCPHCNIYEVRRCTNCSNAFPFYPGDNGGIGIRAALCPKCDPNSGRSQIEFA